MVGQAAIKGRAQLGAVGSQQTSILLLKIKMQNKRLNLLHPFMNTLCVKCKSQHENKCVSHPLTECSLLPFLNPCCNLIQIFLHVIRCVAWQLMYDIWFIGSLCLLQYCLKYFTLHIVFQFFAYIASATRSWKPCFSSITIQITS